MKNIIVFVWTVFSVAFAEDDTTHEKKAQEGSDEYCGYIWNSIFLGDPVIPFPDIKKVRENVGHLVLISKYCFDTI